MTNIVEWKDEELPPVGAIVEMSSNVSQGYTSDRWRVGDRLECIAHKEAECGMVAVFWSIDNKSADSLVHIYKGEELYRKIKTDREKTIEAAIKALQYKPLFNDVQNKCVAEVLFDAGMLKLPD